MIAPEAFPPGESTAAQRRQRLVDAEAARRERKQRARLARQKRGEKAAADLEDVRPEVPPVATCDAPNADSEAIPDAVAGAPVDDEGELSDLGTVVSKGVRGPLRPLRSGRIHPSAGGVESDVSIDTAGPPPPGTTAARASRAPLSASGVRVPLQPSPPVTAPSPPSAAALVPATL